MIRMHKELVFIMVLTLLVGSLSGIFKAQGVEIAGSIYIRADGSVDPQTAPITTFDNVTYTFTGNINDSIIVRRNNIVVDGAGYFVQGEITLVERNNVTIKNMKIISQKMRGIYLLDSSNNEILGNTIINEVDCIVLWNSSYNTISGNKIRIGGVSLVMSSLDNTVSGNIIDGGGLGFDISSYNLVMDNVIINCYYGIGFYYSSDNVIYHNNFLDNTHQLHSLHSTNTWDNGYPDGGNYWSDFTDIDLYGGPHQNETHRDGIWDNPYVIDGNNRDNYPLKSLYVSSENVQVWPYLYYELLDKYSNLQEDYSQLRGLVINELNNVRNLMYAFAFTAIIAIFMIVVVYLAMTKTKVRPPPP
jgi:parallel beta-helix repeat protein